MNTWLPVHIDAQNTGADIQGTIEVSYKKGSGGTATTSTEIDLPATSHKEFFLYIYYTESGQTVNVSLMKGKKVLKKVSKFVNCLIPESTLFGVLADEPSTYDVVGDIKPLNSIVRVAQLNISDLPDRPQAWNSLDALIISNVDTGTLTSEQKNSLQTWVAGGGKLLVAGGSNWQGTASGLKDLMPVQIATTRHVSSLSQLQKYVRTQEPLESGTLLASGTLQKDGHVLVYQDQIPLLVQKPLGFGTVYFLAADPALQPLKGWGGMKDVYEHLFSARIEPLPWGNGIETGYEINRALAAIPELGLPPGLYIWCLLILYILIIGPLNYFVLRRMKRREFGWVSIPMLVIVFTSLSFATGFFYRGVTPTLNRLVVAQAWDGVEQADVHAIIGIYSPSRTKYDLLSDQAFMFHPLMRNGASLQLNDEWHTTQQGQTMLMPGVRGEIGDMKSVAVHGNIPALEFDHNLAITFSDKDPSLVGTITNKSPYTIRSAILFTPDDWERFGDFAPGETKSVKITLGNNSSGPNFFNSSVSGVLPYASNFRVDEDVDVTRREAFLNTLLYSDDMASRGNGGIHLMGWVDDIKLPVQLQGKNSKDLNTVLYVNELTPSITMKPGIIRLPSSMFTWDASIKNVSPYASTNVPSSGYILRYRPAIPISYRTVDSLEIFISASNGTQDLELSAWNYDQKAWVRFDVTGTIIRVTEPVQYVGPDGEVRLQIRYTGTNWMEIQYSYITLTVEQ